MSSAVAATGKVAALDLGEVRTGVAISDLGRTLARPVEIVASGELLDYLRKLRAEEGVLEVVVGEPRAQAQVLPEAGRGQARGRRGGQFDQHHRWTLSWPGWWGRP